MPLMLSVPLISLLKTEDGITMRVREMFIAQQPYSVQTPQPQPQRNPDVTLVGVAAALSNLGTQTCYNYIRNPTMPRQRQGSRVDIYQVRPDISHIPT